MSTATPLRTVGRPMDDSAGLARALDELLDARTTPPAVFAMGEPVHGIEAFPLLRNDILAHLVRRGYRSIALETDVLVAALVDDYVTGAGTDIDTVLAAGFSHGFGGIPGNRALLQWLREHNADRAPQDRVRFHGFDAPLEFAAAPSPRYALCVVRDQLPEALRPASARTLEELAGPDSAWTAEAAMFDPAASIGDSDRAHALRVVADELTDALRRAAPELRDADPGRYERIRTHARAADGLLRYHAAMARPATDRLGVLGGVRAQLMTENLLAILAAEQHRGPSMVFAHNLHLHRTPSVISGEEAESSWDSAGALIGAELDERYLVVTTDAAHHSGPDTLQGQLSRATTRRTLFPAPALRTALPETLASAEPLVPGHIPLRPSDIAAADAIILLTDSGAKQYRYW